MQKILLLIGVLSLLSACSYLPGEVELLDSVELSEEADYLLLRPTTAGKDSTLFIYYPGGLVDPHSYIPMLQPIAQAGYPTLIVKVNANLAITNSKKGDRIRQQFPQASKVIVGGHSLGGVAAAITASSQPEAYQGLILMGSYPTESASLADWSSGSILLFDATNDEVMRKEKLEESKAFLLPELPIDSTSEIPSPANGNTLWVTIEGGNHAQYGSYGEQAGDGKATITAAQQQQILQDYILTFFEKNNW